jgi:hypothetical protein
MRAHTAADLHDVRGAVRGQAGVAAGLRRLQRPPVRLRLLASQGARSSGHKFWSLNKD